MTRCTHGHQTPLSSLRVWCARLGCAYEEGAGEMNPLSTVTVSVGNSVLWTFPESLLLFIVLSNHYVGSAIFLMLDSI